MEEKFNFFFITGGGECICYIIQLLKSLQICTTVKIISFIEGLQLWFQLHLGFNYYSTGHWAVD